MEFLVLGGFGAAAGTIGFAVVAICALRNRATCSGCAGDQWQADAAIGVATVLGIIIGCIAVAIKFTE
jgi:hypothetical protein